MGLERIPDETTILNFRHRLEANDLASEILTRVNAHLSRKGLMLKRVSIADTTIIAAPSSTKNADGERDPEMHQTKKGNQWYFGMKAYIGADVDRSEEHTPELQSLMRISYAVFCLKKKKTPPQAHITRTHTGKT